MTATTPTQTPGATVSWGRILGIIAALGVLIGLLLTAFALPNVNAAPRDLPIVLVAPDPVREKVAEGAHAAAPGALTLLPETEADSADARIREREAYGALVITPEGVQIRTATAASPVVAGVITGIGRGIAAALGAPATVHDVVPLAEEDPQGIGLSIGALPITLGGILSAVVLIFTVLGRGRRMAALGMISIVGGLATGAVLRFWLGTVPGNFLGISAALMLGIAAIGALVLGAEWVMGKAGIGLVAALWVLVGNPLSGAMSAPEMLPVPWGGIGQFFPQGAIGALLRNVGFFEGAATAGPILVLLGWVALGLVLIALPRRRGPAEPAVG